MVSLGAARFPVRLGALELPTPVIVLAGCGGSAADLLKWGHPAFLGAVTSPTLRVDQHPLAPQFVVPVPGGVVRVPGAGWVDPERYAAEVIPALHEGGGRVIASVAGSSGDAISRTCRLVCAQAGTSIAGVELSLNDGVPGAPGRRVVDDPTSVTRAVEGVRSLLPEGVTLLVRLEDERQDLGSLATRVLTAGAQALVVSGGIRTVIPISGVLREGVMSGPAVLGPTAARLRALHAAMTRGDVPEVPMVGAGGIRTARDAAALMAAGASAVGLGSALLNDPTSPWRIAHELPPLVRTGSLRTANEVAGHAPGGRGLAALAPGGSHAAENIEGEE